MKSWLLFVPLVGMLFSFYIGQQLGASLKERDMHGHTGKRLLMLPSAKNFIFYSSCKITYLSGQAIDNRNMVFVLLEGCVWSKDKYQVDIFSLDNFEPIE